LTERESGNQKTPQRRNVLKVGKNVEKKAVGSGVQWHKKEDNPRVGLLRPWGADNIEGRELRGFAMSSIELVERIRDQVRGAAREDIKNSSRSPKERGLKAWSLT